MSDDGGREDVDAMLFNDDQELTMGSVSRIWESDTTKGVKWKDKRERDERGLHAFVALVTVERTGVWSKRRTVAAVLEEHLHCLLA